MVAQYRGRQNSGNNGYSGTSINAGYSIINSPVLYESIIDFSKYLRKSKTGLEGYASSGKALMLLNSYAFYHREKKDPVYAVKDGKSVYGSSLDNVASLMGGGYAAAKRKSPLLNLEKALFN